jgi:ribonuclease P protein subunit RPR2
MRLEEKQNKIARERIDILFEKASNSDRSKRYIELARKIAMKLNIKLTKQQKRKFCKHCYTYLKNGVNATTRTHNKKLIIFCEECKKYTRIPLLKKPSKK